MPALPSLSAETEERRNSATASVGTSTDAPKNGGYGWELAEEHVPAALADAATRTLATETWTVSGPDQRDRDGASLPQAYLSHHGEHFSSHMPNRCLASLDDRVGHLLAPCRSLRQM